MQVRGGRGYETETSLAGRGEAPVPVERLMRDFRINKIFEGSSEIMHLFMAREAVDKHLEVAGALIDPAKGLGAKLSAMPGIAAFYAWWYPTRWLGWGRWPRYAEFGRLATHVRFVERSSRKLARESFHGMAIHQGRMQTKQAFLFRLVDVAMELFAMAASVTRAEALVRAGMREGREAVELADAFCRGSRRRVAACFRALWSNDDAARYRVAMNVLGGGHAWLESGLVGLQSAARRSIARPAEAPAARRETEEPVGIA
jgi:alkylation response protein AidB-like acyl-CoA dehydrogenase